MKSNHTEFCTVIYLLQGHFGTGVIAWRQYIFVHLTSEVELFPLITSLFISCAFSRWRMSGKDVQSHSDSHVTRLGSSFKFLFDLQFERKPHFTKESFLKRDECFPEYLHVIFHFLFIFSSLSKVKKFQLSLISLWLFPIFHLTKWRAESLLWIANCNFKKKKQEESIPERCQPLTCELYMIHNEQVWKCPGGPCTMRSKLNKFEYVWGSLYSEIQVEQVWTCVGRAWL